MKRNYDVVVIGAGPAGLAAATTCGNARAKTLLLDEQPAPGGQIYRSIERPAIADREVLGPDYYRGEALVRALRQSPIEYVSSASVWQVTAEREIGVSVSGNSRIVNAKHVIIATGAQERPFPIPGWTLPGAMTVGAAQILLKKSGIVADGAVFAGTGPLLYLTARQYIRAGAKVTAVIDTTPARNYRRALSQGLGALSGFKYLRKGWRWIREIKAAGVPVIGGVAELRVRGEECVSGIEYRSNQHWTTLQTEHVFLHQGVVPNINLTMSMRCEHAWCDRQMCWRVVTDAWGGTSLPGVMVAGDASDIGGAVSAQHRGTLAALRVLQRLALIDKRTRDSAAAPHLKVLTAEHRFRLFLDVLFTPDEQFIEPQDRQTLVCRCEEVSAERLRETIAVGCQGPNQLKSFTRCGMGPCQGRLCGLTVGQMLATQLARPMADVGYYRLRQPVKPIALGELAALAQPEAAATAPASYSKVMSS
ncbi:FAD-dependent oxidoreductase [Peristeroidobacter agariperforans]|uniref:FAD-dependent oxidoreductase n=1 Tax=Peristeroidobacter agariperforans TaxID=268404 RepID=UPI00101D5D2A|nr:FAD-dependent oxidoreductase [Peristeroidobacter agariperforans]